MKNFIKSNISQESLALLLTQAPVALSMLMGDEFIIQVANPQILQLWGKTPQIIGRKLIDALPELEGQPFMDILSQVRTTGKPYKGYQEFAIWSEMESAKNAISILSMPRFLMMKKPKSSA